MAKIEFERVQKEFPNGQFGVRDFSLTIRNSEFLVIVGPSGCGKSTILRLLAGLEEPTAGTIKIGEGVVNGRTPQERNVAMVFQEYALYPHMTLRQNLEFPLRMRGLARDDRAARVTRAAMFLELSSLLDRFPKQLSGGQRQRVAMGRALVRDPAVFLLDEPLSNLDTRLRLQVRNEIAEFQRKTGTTMVYVTHDQGEAMTLGHRLAVIEGGRLQQVAEPRELYLKPMNIFVAGFIGNPPMNLLQSEIEMVTSTTVKARIAGQSVTVSRPNLTPAVGHALTIGVRPEAFFLADSTVENALVVDVNRQEWLGYETLLFAQISGTHDIPIVARICGKEPSLRLRKVTLAFARNSAALFDSRGDALC